MNKKCGRKRIEKQHLSKKAVQNDKDVIREEDNEKEFGRKGDEDFNNDESLDCDEGDQTFHADLLDDPKVKRKRKSCDGERLFPQEVVWKEADKIWREVTKEDFEFLQNLRNESKLDFIGYLKEKYNIEGNNLPSNLPPLLCPSTSPNPFLIHTAPPPPKQTIDTFLGFESYIMNMSSKGDLDQLTSTEIALELSKNLFNPPQIPSEIDRILQSCWFSILDQEKKEKDKEKEKQKNESEMTSSNSQENQRQQILGKRGRYYREIWSEEEFLEKYPTYPLKQSKDWSEILRNYQDDHDGCYVNWLLSKLHHRKHITSSSTFQPPPRSRSINHGANNSPLIPKNKTHQLPTLSSTISFFAPPVPVTIQHPASWGPGNRITNPPLQKNERSEQTISPTIHCLNPPPPLPPPPETKMKEKLRRRKLSLFPLSPETISPPSCQNSRKALTPELMKNQMIDTTLIHPACVSNTLLLPPGKKCTSVSINSSQSSPRSEVELSEAIKEQTTTNEERKEERKEEGEEERGDRGEREEDYDCIDEIGIHAEYLSTLLSSVSAKNFAYLSQLQSSIEREEELVQLRQSKDRLLKSCQTIARTMVESRKAHIQQSLFRSGVNRTSELTPQVALMTLLRNSSHQGSTTGISSSNPTSPKATSTSLLPHSVPKSPRRAPSPLRHPLPPPSSPSFSSSSPSATALCPPSKNQSNDRQFLVQPIYPTSLNSLTTKQQLNHVSFLDFLTLGSKVEVRLVNLANIWTPCYVCNFKYDEAGLLRFIETSPLSGCVGNCQWNAVEDDCIALPGTHLPTFVFENDDTMCNVSNM